MKRWLSLLLALIVLCSDVRISEASENTNFGEGLILYDNPVRTEEEALDRLDEIRESLPGDLDNHSYFTVSGEPCGHSALETCSNCDFRNVMTQRFALNPIRRGEAYTCLGFACFVYEYLYRQPFFRPEQSASYPEFVVPNEIAYNVSDNIIELLRDNAKTGDILQFYSGNRNVHTAVYIGTEDNSTIVYEANYTPWGTGAIHWGKYSWTDNSNITSVHIMRFPNYPQNSISGVCGEQGENLTWDLSQNGVLTITGSGAMASWEMEQAPWYRFKDDIKEVIIERGVTSIGDFAFYNCSNLSKVTIGEDVTSVGAYGFSYCTSLEEIKIPNSVTEVGEFAFSYCSALKDITLSSNLAKIAMGMFAYCSTLDSIILPQNIVVIEDQAFDGCFALVSITFLGNAPRFTSDTNIFSGVEAFIYYPAQNDTWTAEIMKQYGGNVIWTVESKEEGQKEEVANPVVPTSIDKNWEGSYVYMGHYQLKEIQSEVLTGILDETAFDENNLATVDGVEYYKQEEKYYERVPVRWQVLQQDDTSMLLLSEKILDAHEFDNSTSGGDIRWYNSDLREWLGSEFYNTCFDAEEQAAVITTENSNDTGSELSGGPNTFDKVFLLSDQQMSNSEYGFWGGSDESATRKAHYIPGVETKVTTWTMGFTNKYILNMEDQTCYYWTRTPYNLRYGFALSPMFVSIGGMVGFSNSVVQTWKVGIRPAIQVDKNSDQWYTDIQVRNLYLSQTEMLLGKGQESPLSVTVMPSEYVDTNVLWKSSNPSVASVDQTGMVTAVADGEATITAMSSNGVTASCSVTVGNHVNIGDINADGSVELTDLMSCLHHVSGSNMLEGAPLQAADVNGDGLVDLTDLMRILHYVSGSSTEL